MPDLKHVGDGGGKRRELAEHGCAVQVGGGKSIITILKQPARFLASFIAIHSNERQQLEL